MINKIELKNFQLSANMGVLLIFHSEIGIQQYWMKDDMTSGFMQRNGQTKVVLETAYSKDHTTQP